MATGSEKGQDKSKGFSGLSSLVSDIGSPLQPTEERPEDAKPVSSQSPITRTQAGTQPAATPKPHFPPAVTPSKATAGKWILGIAIAIGAFWFINEANRQPSRPTEEIPPQGRDMVLTAAQVRYCVAEDIRIDAARALVYGHNSLDVDRFNEYVGDYNSRCGKFRYRQGALESARRDLAPYQNVLQSEGRNRIIHPSGTADSSQLAGLERTGKNVQEYQPTPAHQPASLSKITISSVTLGSAIRSDLQVVTPKSIFNWRDTIYASISTDGTSAGAVLAVKWTYEDGQTVNESNKTIAPNGPSVTEFHIIKPDGWPTGDYQVAIFLDGKQIRSLSFSVSERL